MLSDSGFWRLRLASFAGEFGYAASRARLRPGDTCWRQGAECERPCHSSRAVCKQMGAFPQKQGSLCLGARTRAGEGYPKRAGLLGIPPCGTLGNTCRRGVHGREFLVWRGGFSGLVPAWKEKKGDRGRSDRGVGGVQGGDSSMGHGASENEDTGIRKSTCNINRPVIQSTQVNFPNFPKIAPWPKFANSAVVRADTCPDRPAKSARAIGKRNSNCRNFLTSLADAAGTSGPGIKSNSTRPARFFVAFAHFRTLRGRDPHA